MSVKVPKLRPGEVLVLRGCEERDGKLYGHGDFEWPRKGRVSAPDWNPAPACGGGLHGLLRGCGDADRLTDGVYLLVAARAAVVVDLRGKCKFPRGRVVFAGSREEAVAILAAAYPDAPIVYRTATAGHRGTATAGDCGTATAGDWGTATAGDWGTATAGHRGTATAGDWGTATAGDRGTATAGDRGTATAGACGTATAGDCGTATAGDWGELRIRWHDGTRHRCAVGYVGEDGILPNVAYVVRAGKLARKEG